MFGATQIIVLAISLAFAARLRASRVFRTVFVSCHARVRRSPTPATSGSVRLTVKINSCPNASSAHFQRVLHGGQHLTVNHRVVVGVVSGYQLRGKT